MPPSKSVSKVNVGSDFVSPRTDINKAIEVYKEQGKIEMQLFLEIKKK